MPSLAADQLAPSQELQQGGPGGPGYQQSAPEPIQLSPVAPAPDGDDQGYYPAQQQQQEGAGEGGEYGNGWEQGVEGESQVYVAEEELYGAGQGVTGDDFMQENEDGQVREREREGGLQGYRDMC
jgi:hypothetical protein